MTPSGRARTRASQVFSHGGCDRSTLANAAAARSEQASLILGRASASGAEGAASKRVGELRSGLRTRLPPGAASKNLSLRKSAAAKGRRGSAAGLGQQNVHLLGDLPGGPQDKIPRVI